MSQEIPISEDPSLQYQAAKALSQELTKLGIGHVFIGGFAVKAYGGARSTNDIDILIEIPPDDVRSILRPKLAELNKHFIGYGLKYYYAPLLVGDLTGRDLLLANKANVLIETLPTRSLGLPAQAGPVLP